MVFFCAIVKHTPATTGLQFPDAVMRYVSVTAVLYGRSLFNISPWRLVAVFQSPVALFVQHSTSLRHVSCHSRLVKPNLK